MPLSFLKSRSLFKGFAKTMGKFGGGGRVCVSLSFYFTHNKLLVIQTFKIRRSNKREVGGWGGGGGGGEGGEHSYMVHRL
jgi:hypothetical protein